MVSRSAQAITSVVLFAFLALLTPGTSSYAQQTTGQLLISSGSTRSPPPRRKFGTFDVVSAKPIPFAA